MTGSDTLLEIKDLRTYFYTDDGVVKAVDGVDLYVRRGETLGIVGESGSGKSVTFLSALRLIKSPGRIEGGQILFGGRNLLDASEQEMTRIRGNRISMIFQQPQSSLNPVFRVGDQIAEALRIHKKMSPSAAHAQAIDLLQQVGIAEPVRRARQFPHEMSGGMAQRVMIAMALACEPELLIADEPTTALDVTIQAQILDLMRKLRDELHIAIILITHDMGVVAEMADRIAVMYAGRIQEEAPVHELYANPRHPYTAGLLNSVPVLGRITDELAVIPGSPAQPLNLPPGCRFAPRCLARGLHGLDICTRDEADLLEIDPGHSARCWLYHPGYRPAGEPDFGYRTVETST
jgi:oligopeptide/dipeptide ABC transporter ATP-binding protein